MKHNYAPSKLFKNTDVCTVCYKRNYWPFTEKDETECDPKDVVVRAEQYIAEVLHEHFKK